MRPCSIHLIWEKILGGRLTLVKVRESEAKFKDRKVLVVSLPPRLASRFAGRMHEYTNISQAACTYAFPRAFLKSERCIINWRRRSFHALRKYRGRKNEVFARFRSPLTFPSSTTILHYKFFIVRRFIHSKNEK